MVKDIVLKKMEIGRKYEEKAKKILKKIGYKIIEHTAIKNPYSPYDLMVTKEGKTFYVEVRARDSGRYINYFFIPKGKIDNLKEFGNSVLFMFINKLGYSLVNQLEIKDFKKPFKIDGKTIYFPEDNSSKLKLTEDEKNEVFLNCDSKEDYKLQIILYAFEKYKIPLSKSAISKICSINFYFLEERLEKLNDKIKKVDSDDGLYYQLKEF